MIADFLSSDELHKLTGYKRQANQVTWLKNQQWRHVVAANGMAKVDRRYYQKRMGLTEEKVEADYAVAPTWEAIGKWSAKEKRSRT